MCFLLLLVVLTVRVALVVVVVAVLAVLDAVIYGLVAGFCWRWCFFGDGSFGTVDELAGLMYLLVGMGKRVLLLFPSPPRRPVLPPPTMGESNSRKGRCTLQRQVYVAPGKGTKKTPLKAVVTPQLGVGMVIPLQRVRIRGLW